ncbi:hypothetical protein WCLP8_2000004 [uncultured Gammaproteobacteria bacterium]
MVELHYKEWWLIFGDCLSDGDTVKSSAARCDVAVSTSFRWRHRFRTPLANDNIAWNGATLTVQRVTGGSADATGNDVFSFNQSGFTLGTGGAWGGGLGRWPWCDAACSHKFKPDATVRLT